MGFNSWRLIAGFEFHLSDLHRLHADRVENNIRIVHLRNSTTEVSKREFVGRTVLPSTPIARRIEKERTCYRPFH